MKDGELREIEERTEAASPGPWQASRYGDGTWSVYTPHASITHLVRRGPDADFIAHVRTDVPALTSKVRQQSAALDALHTRCDAAERAAADAELRYTLEAAIVSCLPRCGTCNATATGGDDDVYWCDADRLPWSAPAHDLPWAKAVRARARALEETKESDRG